MVKIIIQESDQELGTSIFKINYDDLDNFIKFKTIKEIFFFDHIYKNEYSSKTTTFHNMKSDTGLATYIYLYAEAFNVEIIEIPIDEFDEFNDDYDLLIECESIERGYEYNEIKEYIQFLLAWISHLKTINIDEYKYQTQYDYLEINRMYCEKNKII